MEVRRLMKARVNRQELAEALGVARSVAPSRTPKPILQGVLLKAESDRLWLLATDLEVGVRFMVAQVEVDQTGQVAVSAEKFNDIVRESADDVLAIESDDSVCHIRGADSHFQIYALDAKEFPPVVGLEGKPDFEVAADVLRALGEWTVFSAARENTRYAINGVLWEVKGGVLSLVATDGRRLSRGVGELIKAKEGKGGELSAIVPIKTMNLLLRMLGEGEETVGVKLAANQIIVRTGRAQISSILVEGHFPNYNEVIPKDCDKAAECGSQEFLHAVKRAALLTNEESKGVRLAFTEGGVTLSSCAPQQGEAVINMPLTYRGEPLEIAFNPAFLVDALRAARTDRVKLELKQPTRPGLMSCGENFQYLVMPVTLA